MTIENVAGDQGSRGQAPVVGFETIGRGDVGRVGGKNASLGEMIAALVPAGIRVPPGFATTANAYRGYIAANGF